MPALKTKTKFPLHPPEFLRELLQEGHSPPPGWISGRSIKFFRSSMPVALLEASPDDLDRALKMKGTQAPPEDGLAPKKIIRTPREVKIIYERETEEDYHILIRSSGETRDRPTTPHISIDRLIYDPVGKTWLGRSEDLRDLEERRIRLLPGQSFNDETALGLITLAAMLDFDLADGLEISCRNALLETGERTVSRHILKKFFRKMITGARPSRALLLLDDCDALRWFLPELAAARGLRQNQFHKYDIFYHCVYSCDAIPGPRLILRLAALLHDLGKVQTRRVGGDGEASFHNHELVSARMVPTILRRFDFEPWLINRVRFLVRNHMFHYTAEWTDKAVRRFLKKVGADALEDLITLRMADREGSGKRSDLPVAITKLINHIEEVKFKEAELKVRDLKLNGHRLMDLGMKPGPAMGKLLHHLLELVKPGKLPNNESDLLLTAREWVRENCGFELKKEDPADSTDNRR